MITIREAERSDTDTIIELIHALAQYEKEPEAVRITRENVLTHGFGDSPYFHCILAEWNGRVIGFAVYFFNFSTWEGQPGLYLEDLFVLPEFRGRGAGKDLMIALAQIARERGCTRFQWQVLDWNTPAIEFYERIGARHLKDWYTYRLEGGALHNLADGNLGDE